MINRPSDAIVVLGASVSPSGMLSLESSRRTNHGIVLYRRGLAPVLVLSDGAYAGGPTEADVRAEQARLHGVPADAILTETRAHTTREEALRVKTLLESRGARTILLVTNTGHLARARPLFERAGSEVRPAPQELILRAVRRFGRAPSRLGLAVEPRALDRSRHGSR
jgi:uncharacterized SAM-binding protein YcdF (DUF218 family)